MAWCEVAAAASVVVRSRRRRPERFASSSDCRRFTTDGARAGARKPTAERDFSVPGAMPATHLWWLRVTFRHSWIDRLYDISACRSAAAAVRAGRRARLLAMRVLLALSAGPTGATRPPCRPARLLGGHSRFRSARCGLRGPTLGGCGPWEGAMRARGGWALQCGEQPSR